MSEVKLDIESVRIGDTIRDVEDGDCYYEGTVVSVNPIQYKVTGAVWCGDWDDSMNGQVMELKWWILEKLDGTQWVRLYSPQIKTQ